MKPLNYKKLRPSASKPAYKTAGAGCFDVAADLPNGHTYVSPATPRIVPTGLFIDVPDNHVMLVFSRSGHGFKSDIRLSNSVGVIDSDYTGELMVKLASDREQAFPVNHGDAIAQCLVIPAEQWELVEMGDDDAIKQTERGANGFGSTGR